MSFTTRIKYFIKNHPVLCNFIGVIVTFVALIWMVDVFFLRPFSRHGDEEAVPLVKGLNVDVAIAALHQGGFEVELDSLQGDMGAPGTVVNQSPRENSFVKPGRTIYLRYICYNPRLIKIPPYYGMSRRMALKAFNEAGITNISIKEIPSQDPDLVLAVKYNGQFLTPGKEIPHNAHIVIEVGKQFDTFQRPGIVGDSIDGESYEERILPEDDDAQFIESLGIDD